MEENTKANINKTTLVISMRNTWAIEERETDKRIEIKAEANFLTKVKI
jgi:hypothetical protein